MSITCKAYLNHAPIKDILTVCALLHNAPKNNDKFLYPPRVKPGFGKMNDGYVEDFDGSFVVEIQIDKHFTHSFFLDMSTNSQGQILFHAKESIRSLALGKALVEIFGGQFVPSDSNETVTLDNSEPLFKADWTDGNNYKEKLQFLQNLKPLTKEDLMQTDAYIGMDSEQQTLQYYPYKAQLLLEDLDGSIEDKKSDKPKLKI